MRGEDMEVALTHSNEHYTEEYYSYVNGQYTLKVVPTKAPSEKLL